MSLSPDYAPPGEGPMDLWVEKSNFIGLTCLGSAVNGIAFALWVLCLSALIPQLKRSDKKWTMVNIVFVTVSFGLGTLGNAGSARTAQLTWIDNRNYPGGPNAFTVEQYNIPSNIYGDVGFVLASWLQDVYLLYRFLMFYDMNYWLAIFPALIFLGQVLSSIVFLIEVSKPGGTLFSPIGVDFTTAWFCLSVGLNIILTIAISARLMWKRHAISKILGGQHSSHYTSIVALLVESAALYSVFGIIFVATFVRADPIANLVLPILGMCTVISPSLIIYRVATGRAWTSTTVQTITKQGASGSMKFSSAPRYNTSRGYSTNPATVVNTLNTASYEMEESDKGFKGGQHEFV